MSLQSTTTTKKNQFLAGLFSAKTFGLVVLERTGEKIQREMRVALVAAVVAAQAIATMADCNQTFIVAADGVTGYPTLIQFPAFRAEVRKTWIESVVEF